MVSTVSCQDEFCLEETTPDMFVGFYNNANTSEFKEAELIIWANEKDTLFNGIVSDSIRLPLDTQNNSVVYHLSINDAVEDLTLTYTTEDIFVSKACGFKSVFNNFSSTTTQNNWILNNSTTVTNLTNENQVHVKIFH